MIENKRKRATKNTVKIINKKGLLFFIEKAN